MKRRLVLITRQFWPLVGGAQVVMGGLAHALQERGAEVTILTARWEATWPEELVHGGVRVLRLPQPSLRFWGTWKYMRAVRDWLMRHAGEYDLVYVSMLKHDAYAALEAARDAPVVLRAEATGRTGDIYWQRHARFGRKIARRCREADAFVAIAEPARRELLDAGYPAERIHAIPNGVAIPPDRPEGNRDAARKELAQAHPQLDLPPDARLAVYAGRLDARKGLATLVQAWPRVLQEAPEARLWLVGEGDARRRLTDQIRRLDLPDRVLLAGRYDAVDDFLRAADLFVLPSEEELMSMALLEAMAAGLPIVASDIPANRHLISPGKHGLLAPAKKNAPLAEAILSLLADRDRASTLGQAARRRASDHFSLAAMADAHLELFERLIEK